MKPMNSANTATPSNLIGQPHDFEHCDWDRQTDQVPIDLCYIIGNTHPVRE